MDLSIACCRPCFANSSKLRFVDLSGNRLSGTIPQWVGNLSGSIASLQVHNNFLTGEVPTQVDGLQNNFGASVQLRPQGCAAGRYRNQANQGATSLGECTPCRVGYFCLEGLGAPSACPAGTFRNTTGAQSAADCAACWVGHYCPESSVSPTACPAGTWSNVSGAISYSKCTACPEGHYCPERSSSPLKCPAGSKRPIKGGSVLQDCSDCELGTFVSVEGSSSCEQCPQGMISAPRATSVGSCKFAVLLDPTSLRVSLTPEENSSAPTVSLINTGVRDLNWSMTIPLAASSWLSAPVVKGIIGPGQRALVVLDVSFGPQLVKETTNRSDYTTSVTVLAGQTFSISVSLRTASGAVDASRSVVDGARQQQVA